MVCILCWQEKRAGRKNKHKDSFLCLSLFSYVYKVSLTTLQYQEIKKNRTILYFTYLNKQIINRNSNNLEKEYKQKHMNLFQMSNINRLEMGNNSWIQYLVCPQAKYKKKECVCVCMFNDWLLGLFSLIACISCSEMTWCLRIEHLSKSIVRKEN